VKSKKTDDAIGYGLLRFTKWLEIFMFVHFKGIWQRDHQYGKSDG